MVKELLHFEREAGIPDVVRGISVAAACNESGFFPMAKGDWKHELTRRPCSKAQRDDGACYFTSGGMFQFGGWAKKRLRSLGAKTFDPRFDWRASAVFWTSHVAKQVPRVRAVCPKIQKGWHKASEVDIWKAAHKTAIVKPLCLAYRSNGKCKKWGPRCHHLGKQRDSSHWSIWYSWKTPVDLVQREKLPRAVNP